MWDMNEIRMEVFLKFYKKHYEKLYGEIEISKLPGIDYDKVILSAPEIKMEHQSLTLAKIEVRKRKRRLRRAKRPWWLRWY